MASGPGGQAPDRAALRHSPPAGGPALAERGVQAQAAPAGRAESPTPVAQITRMLAGLDRARMGQFREFLAKEFSSENLDFLVAVGQMDADTGGFTGSRLESAQALHETFIKDGAEQQVNLAGPRRRAVGSALDAALQARTRGESLTPHLRALDHAMGQAFDEILRLVAADSFGRFLAQHAQE